MYQAPLQYKISEKTSYLKKIVPFSQTLNQHGLSLVRRNTQTLQINVGPQCNQSCTHCHLEAGPHRTERMSKKTMAQVTELASRYSFDIIDITGGAPELNPNLREFLTNLSLLAPKIILRCNLTALLLQEKFLGRFLKQNRIQIVASFPSINEAQADSVRGKGVFKKSIRAIKRLNEFGYGVEGTGLTLDLVLNPSGAYLPTSQADLENRFHRILTQKWGITFNRLSTFANVPLGRFLTWLIDSNNLETYMNKLVSSFNPCAVEGLMCRTMLSVSWDGFLFDCDFNLAANLYLKNRQIHVSQIKEPPQAGTPIVLSDHCYTCAAGPGFT